MLFRRKLVASPLCWLALVLLLANGIAAADEPKSVLVTPANRGEVWRVFNNGEVALALQANPRMGASGLGLGTTFPVPSPDQQHIAYTRDGDIWVVSVASGKHQRHTKVARLQTKTLASVDLWIGGWSSDSRRILYTVTPGELQDMEGYEPKKKQRTANYGSYLLELESGSSTPLKLPEGYFLKWLPDGTLLFRNGLQLFVWTLKDRSLVAIGNEESEGSQVELSRNGYTLALAYGRSAGPRRGSQIVTFDLKSTEKTAKPISPRGRWAEYQWPALSPSGERIAFIQTVSGFVGRELIVDGKAAMSFVGYGRAVWIDELTLLLAIGRTNADRDAIELIVWDTSSSKEIARYDIHKDKAQRLP